MIVVAIISFEYTTARHFAKRHVKSHDNRVEM